MKKVLGSILQWAISIGLMVGALYFAFKDIAFNDITNVLINEVNYLYPFLSIPVILLSHYVRAIRWKTFLDPVKKVDSTWNLFSAVMILYAVNTIIPRGGEFLRPYVISKREKISYSSTFATIVLERVIDVISLMVVFGIIFVLLSEEILKILPAQVNQNSIIILSTMIIVVALLNLYPPFVDFMLRYTVKFFSESLYEKLKDLFDKFKKGLYILKSPSKYFRIAVESLLIWVLYALPLFITFYAFDFQSELNLGFQDSLMLVVVAGIAVTIAPSPGGAGVYHLFMQQSMVNLYNVDASTALAFATVVHGFSVISQTVVGFMFFKREGLKSMIPKKEVQEEII